MLPFDGFTHKSNSRLNDDLAARGSNVNIRTRLAFGLAADRIAAIV